MNIRQITEALSENGQKGTCFSLEIPHIDFEINLKNALRTEENESAESLLTVTCFLYFFHSVWR